jgi:Eukaryotic aspartyl protease
LNQLTFFETAIQEAAIPEKVFTADLQNGEPGSYDFGFIDPSKFVGDITYTSVDNSNGFWNITSTGFGIGDESLQSTPFQGIVDTGTTLLIMNDNFVRTYWGRVNGASYDSVQGGYVFPCSETLPSVQIGIEEYVAVVPGAYLNFAPIDSTSKWLILQHTILRTFANAFQLAMVVFRVMQVLVSLSLAIYSSSHNLSFLMRAICK